MVDSNITNVERFGKVDSHIVKSHIYETAGFFFTVNSHLILTVM